MHARRSRDAICDLYTNAIAIHRVAWLLAAPWRDVPMSNFVSGRHFLQTPGPTNLPDRVMSAMHRNAINHRGPEFGALGRDVVAKLRAVFQTGAATIGIFPASGTGAWESALTNTLVPGDRVLLSRTGQFSHLWEQLALCHGLDVMTLETDWRRGADSNAIGQVLSLDR